MAEPEVVMKRSKKTGKMVPLVNVDGNWEKYGDYLLRQQAEETSPFQAGLIGAGRNAQKLIDNTKALFGRGEGFDETGSGYEQLQTAHPVATTVGEIASEAGQLVLPGGLAAKAALKVPKIGKATAATLAGVGTAAGSGFLRTDGDTSERTKAAGSEAMWSALGILPDKLIRGARSTPEADALKDQGVYLTPGQAAESPTIQGVENVMSVTPFAARGTEAARGRGQQEWRNAAFDKVGKELGVDTSKATTGNEAYTILNKALSSHYKKAFDTVDEIPDLAFTSMLTTVKKQLKNSSPAGKAKLQATVREINKFRKIKASGKGNPALQANQLDLFIRGQMKGANPEERLALKAIQSTFHNTLPKATQTQLRTADKAFPDFLALEDAVTKATAGGTRGGFSPQDLLGGSQTASAGRQFPQGQGPLFDIAQSGVETVGRKEGGQPLEWFRRLSKATPSPPSMEFLGKGLMGDFPPQRGYKNASEIPRALMNPQTWAAASQDEEEDNLVKMLERLSGG